jgi:mono/diheme cytochrome c family protein
MRLPPSRALRFARGIALLVLLVSAMPRALAADEDSQRLARGFQALRAMDCARCHGRDYDGFVGPSLLAAVRDGDRARFDRMVLDGDAARGMPGYRSQPAVASELDAIYAYLVARARGDIPAGKPGAPAEAPGSIR